MVLAAPLSGEASTVDSRYCDTVYSDTLAMRIVIGGPKMLFYLPLLTSYTYPLDG
jgi:hypothetical protein